MSNAHQVYRRFWVAETVQILLQGRWRQMSHFYHRCRLLISKRVPRLYWSTRNHNTYWQVSGVWSIELWIIKCIIHIKMTWNYGLLVLASHFLLLLLLFASLEELVGAMVSSLTATNKRPMTEKPLTYMFGGLGFGRWHCGIGVCSRNQVLTVKHANNFDEKISQQPCGNAQ